MDASSRQAGVADNLIQDLNDLLASLSLPITVDTPYDLTPSLLLAILESVLRDRLPISNATRESQTPAAKVEAMKVFLGVLEYDVLQTDIGLSEIDPRRLARGEWDEVVFVGETLCWLGRRHGQAKHPSTPVAMSSSGRSGTNTSVDTDFSRYEASETTATTLPSFDHDLVPTMARVSTPVPQCIHEVEASFSFDAQSSDEDELCDCSLVPHMAPFAEEAQRDSHLDFSRPSVRYHGLIRPVKDEIEEFEAWQERTRSRSTPKSSKNRIPRCANVTLRNPTRHTSPTQYTISLLSERARLLEELAKLKLAKCHGP